MFRWFLVLLMGGGLVPSSAGAQPDSLVHRFQAGNDAYAQGQYARAVDAYRVVLEAGYASGALYYNLGSAYARLDQVGPAIRYYEKARGLRPNDPRVEHNLSQVRRQEGLPLVGLPPRGMSALVTGWSPGLLFGMGWLLFCVGLFGGVLRTKPGHRLGWRHVSVWGPAVAGLLLVAGGLGTSYLQAQEERAVVVVEQVPLRPDPDDAAPPDTTLGAGTLTGIEERRARWTRVRLVDNATGWVPARALGDV